MLMDERTKRREESFFGLHFDFHAKPKEDGDIIPVGSTTDERMIQHIIDVTNPDYIQIDCKGHPGWSSYPTKAGNPYPEIEKDTLRIWRDVTRKNGVALYMHYSGVVDVYQCEAHPEWKRVGMDNDCTPEWIPDGITSTFSPYVDEILIPQLLELAGEYQVDGVWIDGECWGTQIDYSDRAMALFIEKTGIDISANPPRKQGDPNWQEFSDFCREQFRKYMRRYTDTVHEAYPEFQIASNWAFSSKMPELVSVDVDFLSGDYLWADSVNSARYEGRCLASQGKPWDLMAWGFRWRHGDEMERCPKHPVQLKQEAAVVLALGGGFQSYYPQKKDGSMHLWQIDLMGEVAEFCRERESYCHKSEFVPQIAVLNSTYDRYKRSRSLFQCEGEDQALQGIVQLLCESNQSFEIVSEHSLMHKLDKYPVVVIPETYFLEEATKSALLSYAEKGGSLLLVGTAPFEIFKNKLGKSASQTFGEFLISADNKTWAFNSGIALETDYKGATGGRISLANDIDEGREHPLWETMEYGNGKIGFIYTDIGEIYYTRKSHVHRDMIKDLLSLLYSAKVKISGSRYIDLTVMKKDGVLSINLVNTSGPHDDQDVFTIDQIPPTGPISVKVKLEKSPCKVMIQPGNREVSYDWNDEQKSIELKVDEIGIYSIITIE